MNQTEQKVLDTLLTKGMTFHQQGKLAQAQTVYKQILKNHPQHFHTLFLLGVVAGQSKKPEIAVELFSKAIEINPNYAEAHNNQGNAQQELGRFNEALESYARAILINSNFALAHYNKGNALKHLNRLEEAVESFNKAIDIQPEYVEAYIHRGNLFLELKRLKEALADYEQALAANPNIAEAHSNRGNVLQELKKFNEAVASYEKAIYLNSGYAEAYSNRGNALLEIKRYDEAVISYKQAINIQPDIEYLLGALINAKMYMCDWEGFDESLNNLINNIRGNKKSSPPFQILSLTDKLDVQRKVAQTWILDKTSAKAVSEEEVRNKKLTNKIRIGYFSGDFREHPVSYLAVGLFEAHDKDRFELIAFSYGPFDSSSISNRISCAFSDFKNVGQLTDKDIALLSNEMNVDIAIDLSGLTQYGRPGIFTHRAAPIQLSYLGYLGTMGSESYDYLLADKFLIPEENQQYYSEKIIYLPSYQVNDSKRTISDRKFTKEELGLPEKGFVFCCFNNSYKITPQIFDVWMRILQSVPDSVLFLFSENKWVIKNLQKEAEKRGVSNSRLIFADHISKDDYLARYRVADLFLDTLPYNAGTTASDALWTGLPVLTCSGESFASRMAASLLISLELPELITSSIEQYEKIAIDLAKNQSKLNAVKDKLRQSKTKSILFDTEKMTSKIELAYIKIYERNISGLPLDHIYIN